MAMYVTCSSCGAHLDPGEQCDCQIPQRKGAVDQPRVKNKKPLKYRQVRPPRVGCIAG